MHIFLGQSLGQKPAATRRAVLRIAVPSFGWVAWRSFTSPPKPRVVSRAEITGLFSDVLAAKSQVALTEREAKDRAMMAQVRSAIYG